VGISDLFDSFSAEKTIVAAFCRVNVSFIHRTAKYVFEPPFKELRGNLYDS